MTTNAPSVLPEITDPEILGALVALIRAQKRAEEIAARTGTAQPLTQPAEFQRFFIELGALCCARAGVCHGRRRIDERGG